VISPAQATGVILKIDTSLPFDPMVPALSIATSVPCPQPGYSFSATQTGSYCAAAASLNVQPQSYFKVTFEDILVSSTDSDGNGTYSGIVTVP
jgi:hypothetical protein